MPINGLGFTSADFQDQAITLEGSPAMGVKATAKANPLAAQEGTLLFGGTIADGVYSQAYTAPDGSTLSVTVTRAINVPLTDAAMATQAVANATADDAWSNVATFAIDGGTPEQVNITWLHAANAYPLGANAAPGGASLTAAITVNAGGTPVPVGRFLIVVANAQDPDIPAQGLPTGGSGAGDIVGFNLRDGSVENSGLPGAALVESTPAGRMMSSAFSGPVYATNHGSVATSERSAVHVVTSTAGDDELGQARSDAQNSVQLTEAQAYWMKAVQPGERGLIYLNGM